MKNSLALGLGFLLLAACGSTSMDDVETDEGAKRIDPEDDGTYLVIDHAPGMPKTDYLVGSAKTTWKVPNTLLTPGKQHPVDEPFVKDVNDFCVYVNTSWPGLQYFCDYQLKEGKTVHLPLFKVNPTLAHPEWLVVDFGDELKATFGPIPPKNQILNYDRLPPEIGTPFQPGQTLAPFPAFRSDFVRAVTKGASYEVLKREEMSFTKAQSVEILPQDPRVTFELDLETPEYPSTYPSFTISEQDVGRRLRAWKIPIDPNGGKKTFHAAPSTKTDESLYLETEAFNLLIGGPKGITPKVALKRLDVNDVKIKPGVYVPGKFMVQLKDEKPGDVRPRPKAMWFPTKTGIWAPPGEYTVSVQYVLDGTTKYETSNVTLP